MLKKLFSSERKTRGQTAIEYVMMICHGLLGGSVPLASPAPRPLTRREQTTTERTYRQGGGKVDQNRGNLGSPFDGRGQTAIEYVMMISATVVFISLIAYFIKTKVVAS